MSNAQFNQTDTPAASIVTPSEALDYAWFTDGGIMKLKDSAGVVTLVGDVPPAGSVTNAMLADMATKTYKGRTAGGTGVPSDVPVATLKTDLVLVKGDVGLGNVDNTTDVGKPVSTAQAAADAAVAAASLPLHSTADKATILATARAIGGVNFDGSAAIYPNGLFLGRTIKVSGGTFTTGANTTKLFYRGVGGGGGSGGVVGSGGTASGSGGGAAGAEVSGFVTVAPSTAYNITYGAAGAAGASGNNAGGTGGDSTLVVGGTTFTAKGGLGSPGDAATALTAVFRIGGLGQLSTNGDYNGVGESGFFGCAGAGAAAGNIGGAGGSSFCGTGGKPVIATGAGSFAGNAGTGNGSGGGGTATYAGANTAGAAGTAGAWYFDEFSG